MTTLIKTKLIDLCILLNLPLGSKDAAYDIAEMVYNGNNMGIII